APLAETDGHLSLYTRRPRHRGRWGTLVAMPCLWVLSSFVTSLTPTSGRVTYRGVLGMKRSPENSRPNWGGSLGEAPDVRHLLGGLRAPGALFICLGAAPAAWGLL